MFRDAVDCSSLATKNRVLLQLLPAREPSVTAGGAATDAASTNAAATAALAAAEVGVLRCCCTSVAADL